MWRNCRGSPTSCGRGFLENPMWEKMHCHNRNVPVPKEWILGTQAICIIMCAKAFFIPRRERERVCYHYMYIWARVWCVSSGL